jgi:hypothetical protein
MIDRSALPTIESVLRELGVQPGRHNRSRCPIHGGDNPTALSFDDEKGVWYCHRCGVGGDVIDLVENALKTDFKGALSSLGVSGSRKPRKHRLKAVRQREAVDRLKQWGRHTGRQLRSQFFKRTRIIRYAQQKLQEDPESDLGWSLLAVAFDGEPQNEFLLDEIDMCRTDDEYLRAWRKYHNEF